MLKMHESCYRMSKKHFEFIKNLRAYRTVTASLKTNIFGTCLLPQMYSESVCERACAGIQMYFQQVLMSTSKHFGINKIVYLCLVLFYSSFYRKCKRHNFKEIEKSLMRVNKEKQDLNRFKVLFLFILKQKIKNYIYSNHVNYRKKETVKDV